MRRLAVVVVVAMMACGTAMDALGEEGRAGGQAPLSDGGTFEPAELLSLSTAASRDFHELVPSLEWSPNGSLLAALGRTIYGEGRLGVFHFNGSALSTVLEMGIGIDPNTLAWSPNGSYLAVGGWSTTDNLVIYYFNGSALSVAASLRSSTWVYSFSWSPDGRLLAVGGDQFRRDVAVYSFNGSALTLVDDLWFYDAVHDVQWHPSGDYLAVGGQDERMWFSVGKVAVCRFNGTALEVGVELDYGDSADSVEWSPDGELLLVAGEAMTEVVVYQLVTAGRFMALDPLDGADYSWFPYSAAWSPSGGHFAVGGQGDTGADVYVYGWDGDSITNIAYVQQGPMVPSISWNKDGRHLAAGSFYTTSDIMVYLLEYGNLSRNDTATTDEDTPMDVDVLSNDWTVSGDLSVTSVAGATNGTVSISADGGSVVYRPRAEWSGNDSFMYRHSDMLEGSPSAMVNVTVLPVNDAPIITTSDVLSTLEDEVYSVTYAAMDLDGDEDLSWSIATDAGWLSFDLVTLTLEGTPGNGDVGTYSVNVTVTDSNGTSDKHAFTLEVLNVNDDPVISTEDVVTATEDAPYSVVYTGTDVDPTGDLLSWSMATDASWLSMTGSHLWGTPSNEHVGSYWVNVSLGDGRGGGAFSNFTLTVVNTNDAPSIVTVPSTEAVEDEAWSQAFEAVDVDVGDTLTWSLTGPGWLAMEASSGLLSGTPSNDDVGPHWVVVTVSDGAAEDSVGFMLVVANVNDAPAWSKTVADQELREGEDLALAVSATDVDGDLLEYSIDSEPSSGIAIDPVSGAIRWTSVVPGDYEVTVTASDGVETIEHGFSLTVEARPEPPANKLPVIAPVEAQVAKAGQPFELSLSGSDADTWDAGNLSFALASGPPGMVITADGDVLWVPTDDQVGTHQVTVSLSDTKDSADLTFSVTVKEAPEDEVEEGGSYLWLSIFLLLVVVVLVALLMMRMQGQEEPGHEEPEKGDEE